MDWDSLMLSPWLWAAGVALLVLVVWKRRVSFLILAVSFVLFVVLLKNSLPQSDQPMPLSKLLEFIGGTGLLIGVNLYFLVIREK